MKNLNRLPFVVLVLLVASAFAQESTEVSSAEAELVVRQVSPALKITRSGSRIVAERVTAAEKANPDFYYFQLRFDGRATSASNLVGNFAVSKRTATVYDQDLRKISTNPTVKSFQEVIRRNRNIHLNDVRQDELKNMAPL